MNADLIFSRLKGLLGEIKIDIRFAPEYDLIHEGMFDPVDYYDQDEIPGVGEPTVIGDELNNCGFDNPNYISAIPLWEVTYNGLYREQFIDTIQSYSNSLALEYQKELTISRYIGDPMFAPEQFLKLVGDTFKRITYDDQLHMYNMSDISYSDLMKQHNFINRYNKDIQRFFEDLRKTCHDLLVESIEKFEITPVGLVWERNKVELVALIVALTRLKAIKTVDGKTDRKPIISEFDKIFGGILKNSESLLSHTLNNQESDPGDFIKELDRAFQEYRAKKLQ